MMRYTHDTEDEVSEPEAFVRFADRIPEWCVVVGLIGTGQEIHVGEEGGLGQWKTAVEGSPEDWTIHVPPSIADQFKSEDVQVSAKEVLNLDTELRFHAASELHQFVATLLAGRSPEILAPIASRLNVQGLHLRITRDLETAKRYLRDRYNEDPTARYGIIASAKDRDLIRFGVENDFQATKRLKVGPWYADNETDYGGYSCRLLQTCATEFQAQGLELDATLLAWGTDFVLDNGQWSNKNARGYRRKVHDAFQLRLNAYRVLLTRGRDGTVVYVPDIRILDETYNYLIASGFVLLSNPQLDASIG
jgi:DUF2075 family protein